MTSIDRIHGTYGHQVNKNYSAALHVDKFNLGPSYIVGLGDFTGGALWALGGLCSDTVTSQR